MRTDRVVHSQPGQRSNLNKSMNVLTRWNKVSPLSSRNVETQRVDREINGIWVKESVKSEGPG
jgi:hypothetical protein